MTLIEYFDKDTIKNILAVLTLKPERVIYLYDNAIKDDKYFVSLKKCFKKHIPNIRLEKIPVDSNSPADIYQKTVAAIEKYGVEAMEMTGGSELMMIAGHKAGYDKGVRMYHTDIIAGKICDIDDPSVAIDTVQLSLDDFINAKGAAVAGESHSEPDEKNYDAIVDMCGYLFKNLRKWSHTCGYMQAAGVVGNKGLYFSSNIPFLHKNGRYYKPDRQTLEKFEENGFIKDLSVTNGRVSFSYCFPEARTYLATYGLWLEMFVFISAKRLNKFADVKLGTMIDWDAYDNIDSIDNEIDVILMEKSIPVFISCKLREIATPDINELYIEKKRLGGWFSKGMIITSGNDKIKDSGTFKKAKEFGIMVMDIKDITSHNFGERLYNAVSGQDIVAMKWSRV